VRGHGTHSPLTNRFTAFIEIPSLVATRDNAPGILVFVIGSVINCSIGVMA